MIVVEPSSSYRRRIGKSELERFLAEAQAVVRLDGEVNVLLAGNRTLRRLNRSFRKHNKPTDVLSFPAFRISSGNQEDRFAGDLAISLEIANENAAFHGHRLHIELKILLLHGLLHLAGYDHETDHGEMARKERALMRRLGLPAPLIERTAGERHPRVGRPSRKPLG